MEKIEYLELYTKMMENGYFKNDNEYEKAKTWLENGIVPNFLFDEICKFKVKEDSKNEII